MEKNDSNYTLELRRVFNRAKVDQFVVMGNLGGIATCLELNVHRGSLVGIDEETSKVLIYLARAGCAVRYYAKEKRVLRSYFWPSCLILQPHLGWLR